MPPDTEVQHAVPTGGGGSLRRATREALRRVRSEDSAGDHAHPIDRQQPGSTCATYTLVEDAAQPDGARNDHQACHYQVGDLDPAKAAVGEHAPRVPGQVEPVPGQRLGQRESVSFTGDSRNLEHNGALGNEGRINRKGRLRRLFSCKTVRATIA